MKTGKNSVKGECFYEKKASGMGGINFFFELKEGFKMPFVQIFFS